LPKAGLHISTAPHEIIHGHALHHMHISVPVLY
jgi:hypothetical protein